MKHSTSSSSVNIVRNGMSNTIKVFIRPRPIKSNETLNKDLVINNEKKCVVFKGKPLDFDGVFTDQSNQSEVYQSVVAPLIEQVLNGFNCTVFAYGQTGSGKTYTMEGGRCESDDWTDNTSAGLIPRSFSQLFRCLGDYDRVIKVSFVELYNEEVYDLLSPASDDIPKLRIQENKRGGLVVQNLVELVVRSEEELYAVLRQGSMKRQVAATLLNASSSRSHTIFTITVNIIESSNNDELVKIGKLKLVDLAGSENISRSGAMEKRVREASCINKSLLTFGRVIYCLENGGTHVPYRESKLTRLLQDSLGGNAKTIMIANISPSFEDSEDTASTLDYAFRARSIVNKPEVNKKIKKKEYIREYAEKYDDLERDYRNCYLKVGVYMDGEKYDKMMFDLRNHEKIVKEKEDLVFEKENVVREKEEQLVEKDRTIREKEELLIEKSLEVQLKDQLLKEKDFQLEAKDKKIWEKEEELKNKDSLIKLKEELLNETKNELKRYQEEVDIFIRKLHLCNGTTYGRVI